MQQVAADMYILLSNGMRLWVDADSGPLTDVDLSKSDDCERGSRQIWNRIDERGEIWASVVSGDKIDGVEVWRINPSHVVAVLESRAIS